MKKIPLGHPSVLNRHEDGSILEAWVALELKNPQTVDVTRTYFRIAPGDTQNRNNIMGVDFTILEVEGVTVKRKPLGYYDVELDSDDRDAMQAFLEFTEPPIDRAVAALDNRKDGNRIEMARIMSKLRKLAKTLDAPGGNESFSLDDEIYVLLMLAIGGSMYDKSSGLYNTHLIEAIELLNASR